MKKIFTLAFATTAIAAAAVMPGARLPQAAFRNASAPIVKTFGKQHAGKAMQAAAPKEEPVHDWVEIGTGMMTDDITPSYFDYYGVTCTTLEVGVEKDAANEGWYRIVNPWKNYTQTDIITNEGGTLTKNDDITIVIDASDPDYVRVLKGDIGMDDGYGTSYLIGFTELAGVNLGIDDDVTQEEADARAGKLSEGVITFDQKNSLMLLQDGAYYNCNRDGKFCLVLPGEETAIDYTLKAELGSLFCPADDGKYHITFHGDERIPGVKYIGSPIYPGSDEEIDAMILRLVEEGQVVPVNTEVAIDISDATGEEYFAFFCAVDAEGNLAEDLPYYTAFWVPDTNTDGWSTLGNATMTEGFISALLPNDFPTESYQVEVQRNIANPGLYRIVDPYNPWSHAANYTVKHDHSHYIYFNAEAHDNVYIMESALGLDLANFGEAGIGSGYYDMLRQYGPELLEWIGVTSGGSITDNVLSFDNTADIKVYFLGLNDWFNTNLKINPDYNAETDGYYDQYLAGDFKLDMTGLDLSGIADITADDAAAPAQYFNLQGIRVQHPEAGNVYICRRGTKTQKIFIR